MKHLILALVTALFGCSSVTLTTKQSNTINAALQISAIEVSHRVSDADRAKLAAALDTIASKLNDLANAGGVINASDVVAIVVAQKGLVTSADLKRYLQEAAVLIDTQYNGITIVPSKLRDTAAFFTTLSKLINA